MIKRYIQFCLLLCWISNVHALKNDKLDTIHFQAGHVTFNEKTGIATYTEGVSITQGSSNLRANHATTLMDKDHHLMRATAFGTKNKQAHFWTSTTEDKPIFHAFADTIHYYPAKHELELSGHAQIKQGKNKLTAPHIRYDMKAERFMTTSKKDERTVILIDPSEHLEKHL